MKMPRRAKYQVITIAPSGLLLLSGKRDSNPRPSAWEADALPTELFPQIGNANMN